MSDAQGETTADGSVEAGGIRKAAWAPPSVPSEPSVDLPHDEYGRPPRVFISYRRSDCARVAARLAAQLRRDLDSEVYFDRNPLSTIPGDDWREHILGEIDRTDVFVCLVGVRWPGDGQHADGARISAKDDIVRTEIEAALGGGAFPHIVVIYVDLDEPEQQRVRSSAADLFERLDRLQRIDATGGEIRRRRSGVYQNLLVAAWVALKDRIPGSILLVGDRHQMTHLDELVATLRSENRIEAAEYRKMRAGAYIVRRRVRKRRFAVLKKDLPDAIIAVSPDEPTDEMVARVRAVVTHPAIRKVAFVAVGGLATGAGTALTQQAVTWASSSGTTVTTSGVAAPAVAMPAASGIASMTVAGKVAAGVIVAAGAGGTVAAGAAIIDPTPDPVSLDFDAEYALQPVGTDERLFPLGAPPGVEVRLGDEQVIDAVDGTIELVRRSVEVEAYGEQVALGDIEYPRRWSDVSDRVQRGWTTMGSASDNVTLPAAGTGTMDYCYNRADPSQVVAGWEFVDDSVEVRVALEAETGIYEDDYGDLLATRVVVVVVNEARRVPIDDDWDFDAGTSDCPVSHETAVRWES